MTAIIKNSIRPDLEELPPRMRGLPVDERGYPVPYFVSWVDGKPEFRAADPMKLRNCIRDRLCWVCGDFLGVHATFVIGPMCGVNRISAEPPSHIECARWSARNCPFLSNAGRKRREDEVFNEEAYKEVAGVMITRNPGVTLLWTTRKYNPISPDGKGVLFNIGEPEAVEFYASGRIATRAEIDESIRTGLPTLAAMARNGDDLELLDAMVARMRKLLPSH
jgi:hypothetical protein